MNQYLLDTNICVHYLKGEFDLRNKIAKIGYKSCYISEITLAELLYGVENSSPEKHATNLRNFQSLKDIFEGRIVLIGDCFKEYAKQKVALKRKGRIVGEFDMIIGATSLVKSLTLVTRNTKDFINMGNIKLENWIDN